MNRSLVMTLIGPDRPGLVESVAAVVARHEGNWEESRMSHLAGQFAGVLHIRVASDREAALLEELQALKELQVVIHPDQSDVEADDRELLELEVMGLDRPGIVSEVTGCLARHGVNVEELNTEVASAPMSGEVMFRAVAQVRLPEGWTAQKVQEAFEELAEDLDVRVGG